MYFHKYDKNTVSYELIHKLLVLFHFILLTLYFWRLAVL